MSRPQSVGAVALALAAATALTAVLTPDGNRLAAPPSSLVPVVSTTLVCPPLLAADGDASTRMTAWVPRGLPGQDGEGVAAARRLGQAEVPLGRIDEPGEAFTVVATDDVLAPLGVRGVGALAPGLTADLLTTSQRREDRGISSVSCAEPAADAWFVGGASATGRRTSLFLSNAETTPAIVDVDVFGPSGLIESPAGRGVVVGAGATRRLQIDALAPGAGRVALRVRVSSGRVASTVRDAQVDGLRALGSDYVPQTVNPTTTLVIPGLPAGEGARDLRVLVPGEADAAVTLRVITRQESFIPEGLDVIDVSAGTLRTIDLTDVLAGEAVALQLTSNVPITAGAFARTVGPQGPIDVLWAAAVDPIQGLAGVATNRVGGDWTSQLMLVAPEDAAGVEVGTGVPGADLELRTVEIPAGGMRLIEVADSEEETVRGVTVAPAEGSGPVHATRIQILRGASGTSATAIPLSPLRVQVLVPQAVADLSAGLDSAPGS